MINPRECNHAIHYPSGKCMTCGEQHQPLPDYQPGDDEKFKEAMMKPDPCLADLKWKEIDSASERLLPCPTPWCDRSETPEPWQGPDDRYSIICPVCQVEGLPDQTEEGARDNWNTRTRATPPVERNTPAELRNWFFQKLDREQRSAFFADVGGYPIDLAHAFTAEQAFAAFRAAIATLPRIPDERVRVAKEALEKIALIARNGLEGHLTPDEAMSMIERDALASLDEGEGLCEGCPPVGYPTDKTRCSPCPRRSLDKEPGR